MFIYMHNVVMGVNKYYPLPHKWGEDEIYIPVHSTQASLCRVHIMDTFIANDLQLACGMSYASFKS